MCASFSHGRSLIKSFACNSVLASAMCQNFVGSAYFVWLITSSRSLPLTMASVPGAYGNRRRTIAVTFRPFRSFASRVLTLKYLEFSRNTAVLLERNQLNDLLDCVGQVQHGLGIF